MAVTLTQTGIQFPDNTTQSRIGSMEVVATTSVGSGGTTKIYTWSNISQSAKRIILQLPYVAFNSGPQSPIITCYNSQGTAATIAVGAWAYFGTTTSGNTVAQSNYSTNNAGRTNLFNAQPYGTFNQLWLELNLIEDVSTNRKYTFQIWSKTSTQLNRGNGTLSAGTAPITSIQIDTGATNIYWAGLTATVWQD